MELLIRRKYFESAGNLFLIVFLLLFLLFSYAGSASASWPNETIDNVIPANAKISLSADANGKIHVSYIDDNSHSLKYANNILGSWTIATVSSGSVHADGVSLAIDSIGKVHICFQESDGYYSYLRYTTNSSGIWVSTLIDTAVGLHDPGIAIDSNNKIHISYLDDTTYYTLKYATNVSGAWQTSIILSSPGIYPWLASAIAVDKNNKAHICFYEGSGESYSIKYITNVSGSWPVTNIDGWGGGIGGGEQVSIAVDQNISAHVAYYNHDNDNVKYATKASGSWVSTIVGEVGVDYGVHDMSLALDNGGRAHISYISWPYAGSTIALKYVTNKKGAWQAQMVESDGTEYRSSIAISPDQRVHIGYYFDPNGSVYYNVRHALYNDSAPTVTTSSATNVTTNSATLNGTVNPNGLSTTYYFQWGTTTAYGHATPSLPAGSGTGNSAVSTNLTSLTPNTNYHYRLVATNSAGTNYGSDINFKTTSKAMPWLLLLLGE
jgi:hypothetical protein